MRRLRSACRDAKILFCPHDNYTDIYPDCTGFSYDLAVFDPDGRPQLAWYHDTRHAQSYRWASHAFAPFLERNADLIKRGFSPDGLFIDVFTAHPPYDYYERDGTYHTRAFTAQKWGEGFDRVRARWGSKDAPMISEAGADNLVGHVDAGESDHFAAEVWMPRDRFGDSERVPWHDAVTHGKMVLFAGGLGPRYSDGKEGHGYGSDDYLSNTVIGGRNPLAPGEFSRTTVRTHWLLHDVSKVLARAQFESFEFGDDGIHRLHSRFSGGAEVYSNRGGTPWSVAGATLPQYGFLAKAGKSTAAVVEIGGRRAAYARSPGRIFVDARPPENPAATSATGVNATDRPETFTITTEWRVARPIGKVDSFVHIVAEGGGEGPIVHHGRIRIPEGALDRAGDFTAPIEVSLPRSFPPERYDVRYGLYNGPRIRLAGVSDQNVRIRGGTIEVEGNGEEVTRVTWTPSEKRAERTPPVDFGDVKTDGAFRLEYRAGEITISPLPASYPFRAAIDLPRLGFKDVRSAKVRCVDADSLAETPKCRMNGPRLEFSADALSRAYVITLR